MEKPEKSIKFKQNLQILRKRAGLSQEDLAEKMDVSRQSVSKWESGEAYPEMKMLLALCELFHVGLDELIHGDVEIKEDTPLRQKYERLTRRRACLVPVGIGLILIGVTILLALQGIFESGSIDPLSMITPEGFIDLEHADFGPLTVAPLLVTVAIAVVLFIISGNEEDDFKRRYRSLPNLYTEDEVETLAPKAHYFIAAGIGVVVLGAAALMVLLALGQSGVTASAALLGFVAVGAPLIVHGGIIKDSYDIKKYNQENSLKTKKLEEKIGSISGIIMLIATIVYLITGFAFGLWKTTWWVFPIGGILCGITAIILKSRK